MLFSALWSRWTFFINWFAISIAIDVSIVANHVIILQAILFVANHCTSDRCVSVIRHHGKFDRISSEFVFEVNTRDFFFFFKNSMIHLWENANLFGSYPCGWLFELTLDVSASLYSKNQSMIIDVAICISDSSNNAVIPCRAIFRPPFRYFSDRRRKFGYWKCFN